LRETVRVKPWKLAAQGPNPSRRSEFLKARPKKNGSWRRYANEKTLR
jgi:hypothetical protein